MTTDLQMTILKQGKWDLPVSTEMGTGGVSKENQCILIAPPILWPGLGFLSALHRGPCPGRQQQAGRWVSALQDSLCQTLPQAKSSSVSLWVCIGFVCPGFGSRGAKGVTCVRSCWKLLPCLTETMPASSKTNLSLAKVKPISDGSCTYGTNHYLIMWKTPSAAAIVPEC